jgi:predicted SprT family Zn-dependent metalloprotease
MLRFEQLDLTFELRGSTALAAIVRPPPPAKCNSVPNHRGRDPRLEEIARALLSPLSADALARRVRVEWRPRLRTAAGHAACHRALVSLNPRLHEHGAAEIDRTLRHELAHLLAHHRAGRRRIAPHGGEWRQACRDLGIPDETRCHTLPFPIARRARQLLYRCPRCAQDFPRVRRLRRAVACLACCRAHNDGKFARQFQLQLVRPGPLK